MAVLLFHKLGSSHSSPAAVIILLQELTSSQPRPHTLRLGAKLARLFGVTPTNHMTVNSYLIGDTRFLAVEVTV